MRFSTAVALSLLLAGSASAQPETSTSDRETTGSATAAQLPDRAERLRRHQQRIRDILDQRRAARREQGDLWEAQLDGQPIYEVALNDVRLAIAASIVGQQYPEPIRLFGEAGAQRVSVTAEGATLREVLDAMVEGTGLTYFPLSGGGFGFAHSSEVDRYRELEARVSGAFERWRDQLGEAPLVDISANDSPLGRVAQMIDVQWAGGAIAVDPEYAGQRVSLLADGEELLDVLAQLCYTTGATLRPMEEQLGFVLGAPEASDGEIEPAEPAARSRVPLELGNLRLAEAQRLLEAAFGDEVEVEFFVHEGTMMLEGPAQKVERARALLHAAGELRDGQE